MKLRTILSAFILLPAAGSVSAALGATTICTPQIMGDRAYGGTETDYFYDLAPTADGGFIATGGNYKGGVSGAGPSFGTFDVFAVRTDRSGAVVWQRFYGGTGDEQGQTVAATGDGGFIIGSYSTSGITGNKTSPNYGDGDYWIVRVGPDGTNLWDKSFGGTRGDYLKAVIPMPGGGFLLAGDSNSGVSGNKTSPRRDETMYNMDVWIVRTDADGNKLWEQSYGGTGEDRVGAVVATPDGGILLGAASFSGETGNKTTPSLGGSDYWLLRLDANGEILWQRSYGGTDWDELRGIAPASDGGFLIGGISHSAAEDEKTTEPFGSADYWVLRIDANGAKIWETGFGGTDYDNLQSVASTTDGGFLLSGASYSEAGGNKTSPWRGRSDFWIVRINSAGEKRWEESYGGLSEDYPARAVQMGDGRYLLGGTSDSYPRGNKTAPGLGGPDFWVVELAPENPEDCDNDRVPDSVDRCPSTPRGDFVDAQGCGLSQLCPCASPWPTPSNYVACVSSNSARLVAQGAMTEEQRQSVLKAAEAAYCPPPPQDVLVFGLTNRVLGGPQVSGESQLNVSEADPSGNDGISVRLGQADSGVFIYPYASIWGNYDDRWYMRGSAFGRVNGVENAPVSRLRARKPYYEIYPVEVDLSPLQPASVTWQVWSNNTLVRETTVSDTIAEFTVYSASSLGPRANPFWRMPDGSVGALIEFTEPVTESTRIAGPFGEDAVGDRIFARANSPSNLVDYVSHVDVVVGGGVYGFEVLDERPGVFGRSHRILGPGILLPSLGRLEVGSRQIDEFVGVLIEARSEKRLDVTFEPILLTNELSTLTLSLSGFFTDPSDSVGALRFETSSNLTSVSAYILNAISDSDLDLRVYEAGVLQGQSRVTNSGTIGTFPVLAEPEASKVIGIGGGVRAQDGVLIGSFTFDRVTSFRAADGQNWRGDYFQVVASTGTNYSNSLSALSVFTSKLTSFAITGEDSSGAPPSIAIELTGPQLILSWPARNLPIVLEASETLPGTFSRVDAVPVYTAGQYRVTLPASSTGNRFFRLRTAD